MGDISLEPLFNRGASGQGALVTSIAEIGAMSNRTAITVTSAQQITIGVNKNSIEIQNIGTTTLYLGGSGVNATDGVRLFPDESKVYTKVKSDFSFYVFCATSGTLAIAEYT